MNNLLITTKAVLSTTMIRWLSLTDNLPEDILIRTPLPNEWSAMDCLCHLLGENFVDFDPDIQGTQYTTQDPKQLSEEFARLRKSSLIELDKVSLQDLSRTAEHSELGTVTLGPGVHTLKIAM